MSNKDEISEDGVPNARHTPSHELVNGSLGSLANSFLSNGIRNEGEDSQWLSEFSEHILVANPAAPATN
jgi:hypothetical protein